MIAFCSILIRFQKLSDSSHGAGRLQELIKNILNCFVNAGQERAPALNPYLSQQQHDGWPLLLFFLFQSFLKLSSEQDQTDHPSIVRMKNIATEIMVCASVSDGSIQ